MLKKTKLRLIRKLKMTDIALHLQRFDEGITPALTYPLTEIPGRRNGLHSPRIGKQNNLKPFDFTKYQEYLEEVLEVRLRCGKNEYAYDFLAKHYPKAWGRMPTDMPAPLTLAGVTTKDVSTCEDAVRMDTPLDLGLFILRWLRDKNALKPKVGSNSVAFLESQPKAINGLSFRIFEALEKAFETKYYFGVARPSQIFERIYNRPAKTIEAYDHPIHPSYPAGHGAAAGATAQFFYDYFDLETEDWIAIRNAAYLFAQFRTFAGVHYAVDNLAGLQVGGLDVGFASV